MKYARRTAFTLVELLVVIAIIGILVALLLPAVQAAREAARRLQCTNNLTQLALAVQNYEMAYRMYPPGTLNPSGPIVNKAEGYHHNWLTQVLPYMEETNVFNHVDFQVGVYDAKNEPVRKVRVNVHHCPSDSAYDTSASNYAGVHHDLEAPINTDNHGVFFLNSVVRYENIPDGTSHTLFIGEKSIDKDTDLGWMSGTRATLRNTGAGLNADKKLSAGFVAGNMPGQPATPPSESPAVDQTVGGFSSHHPGGCQFAFGDGHVSFLSNSLPLEVLQQLAHRADGKLPGPDEQW